MLRSQRQTINCRVGVDMRGKREWAITKFLVIACALQQSMLDELAYVHRNHFKVLHMRPDTLITTLGPTVCELFDHLSEGVSQSSPPSSSEAWRAPSSHSSGSPTQEKVSDLSEEKENKIMMIMEITTMNRREALRLLESHRWSIEHTLNVHFHGL